ncbi:hypothetical protein CNEO_280006 [Clostridium neonatale]|nr:hypothetical protein CNEO_280006 [Clostridium neonatale]
MVASLNVLLVSSDEAELELLLSQPPHPVNINVTVNTAATNDPIDFFIKYIPPSNRYNIFYNNKKRCIFI